MAEEKTNEQVPDESTTPQAASQEATSEATPKPDLPEIGLNVEDAGTLKKKITVTVPRQRIDAKFDEMFGELSTSALVPGFRIGHAPRKLVEKRFGKEVSTDVRNAVIGQSLGEAVDKMKLKTVGEPTIDLEKIELPDQGDLAYSFEVEVAPEFELPELKGIKVTRPTMEVNDQRVNEYLDHLRQERAKFEPTDGAAAEGDHVVAGATIRGEGIDEVDRPGLHLRVAPGQVESLPLLDLGKALTGKKAGETAELTVTVPQAHPNEAWRGKSVTVTIAISEVQHRVLPELDEAFAQSIGFSTMEEMRTFVATRLGQQLQQQSRKSMRDQVQNYLLDSTKLVIPEGVASRHAVRLLSRRYVELLNMGVPREKIDENITQLQAAATEQASTDLKLSFILAKVAEQEKIEIADGEINARIASIAASYNRRPERLRQELEQEGTLEELVNALSEEKALDKVLELAEITEQTAAAAPAEEAAEKPAKKTKAKKSE